MSHSRTAQHLLLALAVSIGAALPSAGLAQDAGTKPAAGANPTQASPAPDVGHGRTVALTGPGNGSGEQSYPCYTCHGRKGEGGVNPDYPRIGGQSYAYLYQQLEAFKSGERQSTVMQQVATTLDDKAMRDVSAYYAEQAVPPEDVGPTRPAGAPAKNAVALQNGGALAAYGDLSRGIQGCANCHGPKGGGEPPIYPSLAGQPAEYLAEQLKNFRSGERRNDTLGVMQDIAKRMSDQQMEEVAQYYAAIRPVNPVPQTVGQSGLMPPPLPPEQQGVPSSASDQQPIAPAPQNGAAP
jgi:cytochrome c553